MKRASIFFAGIVLSATPLSAKQLTIETNDNAMLIRCIDQFGHAQCEMVFESSEQYYNCIAFNAEGKPIATGIGNGGSVRFSELDPTLVADVSCR